MTKAEVVTAQRAWARCVTEQDVDGLLDMQQGQIAVAERAGALDRTLQKLGEEDVQGAQRFHLGVVAALGVFAFMVVAVIIGAAAIDADSTQPAKAAASATGMCRAPMTGKCPLAAPVARVVAHS